MPQATRAKTADGAWVSNSGAVSRSSEARNSPIRISRNLVIGEIARQNFRSRIATWSRHRKQARVVIGAWVQSPSGQGSTFTSRHRVGEAHSVSVAHAR
jgi:hypothetical protein